MSVSVTQEVEERDDERETGIGRVRVNVTKRWKESKREEMRGVEKMCPRAST